MRNSKDNLQIRIPAALQIQKALKSAFLFLTRGTICTSDARVTRLNWLQLKFAHKLYLDTERSYGEILCQFLSSLFTPTAPCLDV